MKELINTLDIQPGEWFTINGEKLKYERGGTPGIDGTPGTAGASFVIYTAKNWQAIEVYRKAFYVMLETFSIQPAHIFLIQELQSALKREYRIRQKERASAEI